MTVRRLREGFAKSRRGSRWLGGAGIAPDTGKRFRGRILFSSHGVHTKDRKTVPPLIGPDRLSSCAWNFCPFTFCVWLLILRFFFCVFCGLCFCRLKKHTSFASFSRHVDIHTALELEGYSPPRLLIGLSSRCTPVSLVKPRSSRCRTIRRREG